ncbi:unnamed protein product [Penicillium camemberti]|uniref:Str. FM013 n=1 Tax=Penicillium camemberti (strain FM 013) TaxID=1429867 RepID=A0A0G4NXS5_PENC3|nr:unnamed protein product [Penicillium camemberti]
MVGWMPVGLLNLGEHIKQIRLDVTIAHFPDDLLSTRRVPQHNGYTCAKSFGRTTVHAPLLGHESART